MQGRGPKPAEASERNASPPPKNRSGRGGISHFGFFGTPLNPKPQALSPKPKNGCRPALKHNPRSAGQDPCLHCTETLGFRVLGLTGSHNAPVLDEAAFPSSS